MINRRTALKKIGACGALVGLSVLMPGLALAAWNKEAFAAVNQDSAMRLLFETEPVPGDEVSLKAPRSVVDGALVPVTVKTTAVDVESITLFVEGNPNPLIAEFIISEGTKPEVRTRIRMAQTSTITAVVKAQGLLHSVSLETKVTIGGCVDKSVG